MMSSRVEGVTDEAGTIPYLCPVCAGRMKSQLENGRWHDCCNVCGYRGIEIAVTPNEVAELHRRRDAALAVAS